jgi:hypothetical protein
MTERPMDEVGDPDDRVEHWHFTKGIPVVFMVSMFIYVMTQIGIGAWFASSMSSRIEQIERVQSQAQVAIERVQNQAAPQGERLTRVEEKLVAVQTGIADIKTILQSPNKPSR